MKMNPKYKFTFCNICARILFMIAVMTGIFCLMGKTVHVYGASGQARVVFSDLEIRETAGFCSFGYRINGTTLTIEEPGIYEVSGSCGDGSIVVGKNLSDVTLILNGLSLRSTTTAPLVIKGSSQVTVHLNGISSLYDDEDSAAEETGSDFEGAAIKAKNGSRIVFCGDGTLNVFGNAKNGIKGGSRNSITFNGGTYNVSAVNNGIVSDGSLIFNDGNFTVNVENDGIKAVPEAADADSAGEITVNGGIYKITTNGDGIQADSALIINNGEFEITTYGGYNAPGFNNNTMSCKGLKASGDRENVTNTIEVNGGTFTLNTADDALHSDANVKILGGTFTIQSGDDGIHADTMLTLGETESADIRDPEITIGSSYEGFESADVFIFNGKYKITASDDGINAGGGSANGTDPGQGGRDPFRPGWGGGFNAGGGSGAGDYSINVCGGELYVDCNGDGLDSNGTITISGGDITVFSMRAYGDNAPIDADGTILITGGTILAAGSAGVDVIDSSVFSGLYFYQNTHEYYTAGTTLAVYDNGTCVRTDTLTRNVSYVMYSSPALTGTPSVAPGPLDPCRSNPFRHSWSTPDGLTYTCTSCGAVEYKGSASTVSVPVCIHDLEEITCEHKQLSGDPVWIWDEEEYDTAKAVLLCDDCGASVVFNAEITSFLSKNTIIFTAVAEVNGSEFTDERTADPFMVSFETGSHAAVDVYYTQDFSEADETAAVSAAARDGKTGYPVISGDGQVNFKVNPEKGYVVSGVEAVAGTYKNIKGPNDIGIANAYRITKVSASTTVTVTVVMCTHRKAGKPVWQWADDNTSALAVFSCADCGCDVFADAVITQEHDVSGDVIFTAAVTLNGRKYTDQKTVKAVGAASEAEEDTSDRVHDTISDELTDRTEVSMPTAASVSGVTASGGTVSEDAGNGDTVSGNAGSRDLPAAVSSVAAKADASDTAGVSAAEMNSVIIRRASDKDVSGSTFYPLRLSGKPRNKTCIKLSWKKVKGASGYVIYGNKCGKKNRMKKIAETKKTFRTIKKLKKDTYYKFLVVAVKDDQVLAVSKISHIATKGGSKGNPVSVQANRKKVKVKVRKTKKIEAKEKTGTLKVSFHRKLSYESSDPGIAKVNKKGKVTGVSRGECIIYVYAQNGKYAKVKVTVS